MDDDPRIVRRQWIQRIVNFGRSQCLKNGKMRLGIQFHFGWKKTYWYKMGIKNKLNAGDKLEKYKSYLVDKGYSHVEGINFRGISSHVAKLTSIGFIFSILVYFDL